MQHIGASDERNVYYKQIMLQKLAYNDIIQ